MIINIEMAQVARILLVGVLINTYQKKYVFISFDII